MNTGIPITISVQETRNYNNNNLWNFGIRSCDFLLMMISFIEYKYTRVKFNDYLLFNIILDI